MISNSPFKSLVLRGTFLGRKTPILKSRSARNSCFTMASEVAAPHETSRPELRFIDIGINLTDPVYSGSYHGTQRHENDLSALLQRAKDVGCKKLIITGSDLEESKRALNIAKDHPGFLFTTVGVHPCSCDSFKSHADGPASLLSSLKGLATASSSSSTVVAFGEIGLDYDRLGLCSKEVQLEYFEKQLNIATEVNLPLFLHSRAAATDFANLLRVHLDRLPKRGVVHSFTGTLEEMQELVEMGFDIGINGCSLKTEENVEVVRQVPLERLQLETDGPWCEMRASHASAKYLADYDKSEEGLRFKSVKKEKFVKGAMVKGRNEPCTIPRVAVAVAGIKGLPVEEVAEKAWENTIKMFGLGETS